MITRIWNRIKEICGNILDVIIDVLGEVDFSGDCDSSDCGGDD